MFLGGLTARAMQLKEDFSFIGIKCFETYPAALAKSLLLQEVGYKKKGLEACLDKLEAFIPKGFHLNKSDFSNWHRFDALMAWISAYALKHGKGEWIGDEQEGLIGVYRPSTI
jgi:predicted nuclease with RNAse H fold